MKFTVLSFLICLSFIGCASNDTAWELATSRTTTGRNHPNKCSEFAQALHHEMQTKGIKSHVLVYVATPAVQEPVAPGYNMIYKGYEGHAMCIYWDDKGGVWAMDNQLMRPVRISDGTPEHMARVIATPARNVSNAYFADAQDPPIKGWEPGPNYRRLQ